MGLIKCVVPGCEDRCSPRHRIPVLDQELYEEWLKRIGSKELTDSDPKFVGTNKRVCSIHFSSHCRIPNSTKLKNRSVPTLHLPGFQEKPSAENSILKYPRREITIARAELLRYIKDFKPDPEDSYVDESKPGKPATDPLAISDEDANEIQLPSVDQPTVKTPELQCNRLLAQTVESLNKELALPAFASSEESLTIEADCKDNLKPLVTADLTADDKLSHLDILPPNKVESDVKRPLSPALDYTSSGETETEDITEPMNIDFTYLMKITSLPDSPLIKDEPSLKNPSVQCPPVKKSVGRPAHLEVVCDPLVHYDATSIEPMNIDFTYLMKITSLPDSPLIKDDSPLSKPLAFSQPTTVNLSDPALDCLSYPSLTTSSPAPEDTLSHSNLIPSTFDLEELIHERCKSLLAEIPSTSYE